MAGYASGNIRVPGLSGNDTDFVDMIKKLKSIESRQLTQLTRWREDWKTRLNAFRELRTELMNLQTTLNKLNSMSKFMIKSAVSSDDKVVTAVADADAMNSSYSIEVKQKATNTTWTKDTGLYDKNDVICDNDAGGTFTYTYKGKSRTVTIPRNTTAEGFVKLINNDSKNPGVKAQLIQTTDGIAFQLRGMDTGQSSTLVINETIHLKGLDVSPTGQNYDVTESSFTYLQRFDPADLNEPLNTEASPKTFVYTVDGIRRSVSVEQGESISDLVGKINALTPDIARLKLGDDGKYTFSLEKPDITYAFSTGSDPLPDILAASYEGESAKVNTGTTAFDVTFSLASPGYSETFSVSVTEDMTLRELANAMQAKLGDKATAKIVADPDQEGRYKLVVEGATKTHRVTVENGSLENMGYEPPTAPGWDVNHAVNAKVRINGYPKDPDQWMEVASNTLKSGEVIPGVTFYLHSIGSSADGIGRADISVSTDTAKIQENIEEFVDAVNSFRTKLISLTEYDENKQVLDLEFAESQFEMQKGGVLQGNYGVQLIASRLKNLISSSATGFFPRILDTDGSVLSGDLFTTLSQIGITTNATHGEANYGLLEINTINNNKGAKSLNQALLDDPEAVARLFATSNEGNTDTDKFHYNSHLPGITKAGNYSVQYKIDPVTGEITDATINNQAVTIDQEKGTITAVGDNNPARGMVITVADRTGGLEVSGTVSIRSGKINELLDLLNGSEGILGSNGTLRNLEKNYQGIIDGIDKKIERENSRLTRWESTMVLKFARLESVLANYAGIQSTLESQIAQLGNSNK